MASPSDSNQQQQRFFTWADIARISAEKTNDQLLTVIHNKVYDIGGDFATAFHPGGRVALSQVGFDATGAFEEFHQASAHEVMANFYVGDLEPSEVIFVSHRETRLTFSG